MYSQARSLISPAAGNLSNQSALFGTRLRMLHLEEEEHRSTRESIPHRSERTIRLRSGGEEEKYQVLKISGSIL